MQVSLNLICAKMALAKNLLLLLIVSVILLVNLGDFLRVKLMKLFAEMCGKISQ